MNQPIHTEQIESLNRIILHLKCLIICPSKGTFFLHGIKRELDHRIAASHEIVH